MKASLHIIHIIGSDNMFPLCLDDGLPGGQLSAGAGEVHQGDRGPHHAAQACGSRPRGVHLRPRDHGPQVDPRLRLPLLL